MLIQPLQLCLTQHGTDLMITEVESISHEQERRINTGFSSIFQSMRRSLTCHAMTTLQSHHFIEFSVVGTYHTTLNGGHVVTKVETERRCNRFTTTFLASRSLHTMRLTHIFQDQGIWKDLTNLFNRCRPIKWVMKTALISGCCSATYFNSSVSKEKLRRLISQKIGCSPA